MINLLHKNSYSVWLSFLKYCFFGIPIALLRTEEMKRIEFGLLLLLSDNLIENIIFELFVFVCRKRNQIN